MVDALALKAEEGRGTLRKALGSPCAGVISRDTRMGEPTQAKPGYPWLNI
jgi:hypothetical protein